MGMSFNSIAEDDFHWSADPSRDSISSTSQLKVEFAALSNQGKMRKVNDDAFLVARADRTLSPLLTNLHGEISSLRFGETAYGMLIADGLGGTEAGREVSTMAIRTFVQLVLSTPDWILRTDECQTERVMMRMAERFRKIHLAVIEKTMKDPALSGVGATLTLACSAGRDLIIAHIGNSRVYLFRQAKLIQLTRDHTLAQNLADIGAIKHEDAAFHQAQHFFTDTIGSAGRGRADVQTVKLQDRDRILLCTDGLTQLVEDPLIASALTLPNSPSKACHMLIELALARGGADNITAILAHYHIPVEI
jgi:PPM family protein phosphatase